MRKLSQNKEALAMQARLWGNMEKQFQDRQTYWNLRSISRLGQDVNRNSSICLIIDGMDRAKWSVPRSAVLAAKSLNGLQRPNLDCTGIIVHGHMVCTAFGYPGVIKGANWTCELLTFVFDKLVQSGIDLRHYEINLQSDNATKESKNNSVARMLSFYVSRGLIRCARMHYCVSGHSHEDIDQYFSLLGSYLQTQSELHDPEQFAESLRRYLSNTSVRPLERMREVVQVDQVRDWLSSRNPKYFARFSFQSFFSRKKTGLFCVATLPGGSQGRRIFTFIVMATFWKGWEGLVLPMHLLSIGTVMSKVPVCPNQNSMQSISLVWTWMCLILSSLLSFHLHVFNVSCHRKAQFEKNPSTVLFGEGGASPCHTTTMWSWGLKLYFVAIIYFKAVIESVLTCVDLFFEVSLSNI